MPKQQTTASKKARAAKRANGGKHTELLAAQTCGSRLDPWGIEPATCARPPHPDGEPHSENRDFDVAEWQAEAAAEQAAADAIRAPLSGAEREESERLAFEEEHDDGLTASDAWEDARSWKWED